MIDTSLMEEIPNYQNNSQTYQIESRSSKDYLMSKLASIT